MNMYNVDTKSTESTVVDTLPATQPDQSNSNIQTNMSRTLSSSSVRDEDIERLANKGLLGRSFSDSRDDIRSPIETKEEDSVQLLSPDVKMDFSKAIDKLRNTDVPKKEKLEHMNKLVELSEQVRKVDDLISLEEFIKSLRVYVIHTNKTLRTASLRILRYYMRNSTFIRIILRMKLHFFVVRSLEREKQNESERMQALKLVRKILETDCSLLPRNVVHCLVSIAEHPEDNFSRVAVETLCEITVRNPRLSAHCGGIKVLVNSVLDPNHQGIQETILLVLVYMLNHEETRKYLRPALDIGTILGPLSENFYPKDKTPEKESRWSASIRAICSMLKTWTGLIALASHPLGLKTLVDSLRLPCPELHDRILSALFDIFRLTVAKDSNPFQFKAQKGQATENAGADMGTEIGQELPSRTRGDRHNLLNNYLSALLIIFIDCGLVEGLVELGSRRKEGDSDKKEISVKASLLLGELLYLTNTLLPPAQCARVQTLPVLVKYAASFSLDPRLRSRASSMITNLHQYHHLKHTSAFYDFHLALIVTGASKWKRLKGRDRRLDRMDEVKIRLDFAMDLDQFKYKLQETQVLTTKEHTRWKWDIIFDLLEGAFNNPNLSVSYALQRTKFVKRILSFLRPSKKAFAKMPWSLDNLKYVRMACQLFEALVSTDIGRDYLLDNKLMQEISDQLKLEVDHNTNKIDDATKKETRLLSPDGVLKTMSREYFTMLGTLSSSAKGLEILKKWNIFPRLIEMTELHRREDLTSLIMRSLDYNIPGQSRVILSKALTSASKVVRYLATRHMLILLRAGVHDFYDWGVELLVKQLNDPDIKVTKCALNILDEACDETDCMDSLIAKRPSILLNLGSAGKDLWRRFLSRPSGFKYLSETNFLKDEMLQWKTKLNADYASNLERALTEAFSPSIYKHRESDHGGDGVNLPPHFYGELAKTQQGCEVLQECGDVKEFISCIKLSKDPAHLKASLWTLGHIGSSKTGFQFITMDVLKRIVNLAETCECISIRGTCFYVLGMISKIDSARELLDSLGWESPINLNSCISVPKDLERSNLFKIPVYPYEGSFAMSNEIEYQEDTNEIVQEILTTVTHLSNFISAESASRTLKRLKATNPDHFTNPKLLYQVFMLMGTYKFRLPVRRFIYDVFDSVIVDENTWKLFEQYPSEITVAQV